MSNVTGVQQARDRVLQMARQIEELSQSAVPAGNFLPGVSAAARRLDGGPRGAIWLAEAGRLALAHELRYADMGIRDNANAAAARTSDC